MSQLSDLIFGNIFLILLIGFGAYLFLQFKFLSEKNKEINKQFDKVLSKYLNEKIVQAKETTDNILKEYGREDAVSTEISRLLLTIEKGESGDINDKVITSNAINKFKLSKKVDLERYPSLKKLDELGTFTVADMSSLDNGIALARKEYNALAFRYNEKATGFPLQYLTKLFGFKEHFVIFDAPKSEKYDELYEVFEEEEPEINLISSLNLQNREEKQENDEKIEQAEEKEIVMEYSDIVLKPTKALTELTDDDMPVLKSTPDEKISDSANKNG